MDLHGGGTAWDGRRGPGSKTGHTTILQVGAKPSGNRQSWVWVDKCYLCEPADLNDCVDSEVNGTRN
jgi:hypothetical protein